MHRSDEKAKVLHHLLQNLGQIVRFETLEEIANPANPTSLLLELQRKDGWPITRGQILLDMIDAGEIPTDSPEYLTFSDIRPQDVVLFEAQPDPDAKRRWKMAGGIRRAITHPVISHHEDMEIAK